MQESKPASKMKRTPSPLPVRSVQEERDLRLSKISELIAEVIMRLDSAAASQGCITSVDSVHLLLQTLQWQLGLAMVMLILS